MRSNSNMHIISRRPYDIDNKLSNDMDERHTFLTFRENYLSFVIFEGYHTYCSMPSKIGALK